MLTLHDVAKQFKSHDRTILRWVEAGKFPKPKKIGHKILWLERDIELFANSGVNIDKLSPEKRKELFDSIDFARAANEDDFNEEKYFADQKLSCRQSLNLIRDNLGLPKSASNSQIAARFMRLSRENKEYGIKFSHCKTLIAEQQNTIRRLSEIVRGIGDEPQTKYDKQD